MSSNNGFVSASHLCREARLVQAAVDDTKHEGEAARNGTFSPEGKGTPRGTSSAVNNYPEDTIGGKVLN